MSDNSFHPAAIQAAKNWSARSGARGYLSLPIDVLARYIHAAIDDHLKEQGWLNLRGAVEQSVVRFDCDDALQDLNRALLRVKEAE